MAEFQNDWGARVPWGDRDDLVVHDGWGAHDFWGNPEPQPHPREPFDGPPHHPREPFDGPPHHSRGLFEDVFYYIHHDGRESDAFEKLERVLAVSPHRLACPAER